MGTLVSPIRRATVAIPAARRRTERKASRALGVILSIVGKSVDDGTEQSYDDERARVKRKVLLPAVSVRQVRFMALVIPCDSFTYRLGQSQFFYYTSYLRSLAANFRPREQGVVVTTGPHSRIHPWQWERKHLDVSLLRPPSIQWDTRKE